MLFLRWEIEREGSSDLCIQMYKCHINVLDGCGREYRNLYKAVWSFFSDGSNISFSIDEDIVEIERIEGSNDAVEVQYSLDHKKVCLKENSIVAPHCYNKSKMIEVFFRVISSGSIIDWKKYQKVDLSAIEINENKDLPLCVIFLDMDGVMIHDRHTSPLREQIGEKMKELYGKRNYLDIEYVYTYSFFLYERSVSLLHALIAYLNERCRIRIVMSSAWKDHGTLDQLKDALKQHAFSRFIIDKTPYIDYCNKNKEISSWLSNNKVDKYIVFDDQDHHYFSNHIDNFLRVDSSYCLSLLDVVQAISMLQV